MSRNIVICLDGTANEPERSSSNVLRAFSIAAKDDTQLVYYDPGVGTLGDRSRSSRIGKAFSRLGGLAMGHGINDKIAGAYRFLMNTYEPGDQIYLFGFSRGAYTVRALAGLLRCVGLLRPGLDNMVPYAMKLYTRKDNAKPNSPEAKQYWGAFNDLHRDFGNPDFPGPFQKTPQIRFVGLWDTVKFVGWFNLKGQFQQARWPFTRKVAKAQAVRHALALDERRRYYAAYRLDQHQVDDDEHFDVQEMWFAGVHSDVGGGLNDPQPLADISLHWILAEAQDNGLRLDPRAYRRELGVQPGKDLPDPEGHTPVSSNRWFWRLAGFGWRKREPRPEDEIHPSVELIRTQS